MMRLTVNGEPREHAGTGSVRELLAELRAHPDRVALMVNDRVVRRRDWDAVRLRDGDRVELLTFAGGG